MTLIQLREHESFPPKGMAANPALRDVIGKLENVQMDEQDSRLQDELNGILGISRDPVSGCLRFKAYGHVGRAQFSGFAVEITPKFSELERLVDLINYVYDLDLETFEESEIRFAGQKSTLSELIISAFVKKCQRLVRHGLARSYNLQRDDLPFLRGSLVMPEQILNHARSRLQFACEYDVFNYNNLENRIVLFCLRQCYNITANPERRNEIGRLARYFSGRADLQRINIEDLERIRYTRMNSQYKKIHELCRLIMHSARITDFDQKLRFINSFFVDMNVLFEKFVLKLFARHYPLESQGQVSYDSWQSELDGRRTQGRIDIMIRNNAGAIHAIIDTKYKTELSDSDRYQLEHYMLDHEKTEAYAVLPRHRGSVPDSYRAVGRRICIKVRHIDIDRMLGLLHDAGPAARQEIRGELLKIIPMKSA